MADSRFVLVSPPKASAEEQENIRKLNWFIQKTTSDNNKLNLNYSKSSQVKISANDTTADYLDDKLVAGTGITLTENNDGNNETLTIAAHVPVTLATNHGLGLTGQVLNMGTPSTCTLATTNAVTTTTHTHALSGITTTHAALTDMPDTLGTNVDHDERYRVKNQNAQPTTTGDFWWDADAPDDTSVYDNIITYCGEVVTFEGDVVHL